MKELKALEVLTDWINGNYPSKKEIEEAIAELEALKIPKTCPYCNKPLLKVRNGV